MLKRVKDKLYYYFAEKNWGVHREYGPYVDAHQEEHSKRRWKHWWMLVRLNWHYRIRRKTNYLYLNPKESPPKIAQAVKNKNLHYPESTSCTRNSVDEFVEELLKFDVISFDVFDTLVFRPFEDPKDLFTILAIESNYSDFKEVRTTTESYVRQISTKPNREIDIYDIYECMQQRYGIDAERWSKREIELEVEFCYANPYMMEAYKRVICAGKMVVATSDMYLPGPIIKQILDKCGYTEIERIFVSCDYHCGKRTGQLQHVVQQECGRYKKYIHVGDNFNSDVKASRSYGWNAWYYKNINECGAKYRPQYAKTLTRSTYSAIVNAELHSMSQCKGEHYEHGFVYGGILVCGYCEWLNRLAKEKNIDKFLFVARDANIISKVYNRYYKEVDNDFVFASRFALFQTDFKAHIHEFIRDVIFRRKDQDKKTIGDVLAESDLLVLQDDLKEYNLSMTDIFTDKEYNALEELIFAKKEKISLYFEDNRQAALSYISGFVKDSKNICIVDVGWKGTCTQIISDLIYKIDPQKNVIGAFLGTTLHESIEPKVINNKIYSYLFSKSQNWDLMQHGTSFLNVLIEFMFSAPIPTLLQYTKNNKGVIKFDFGNFQEKNYEITKEIQKGILEFSKRYNEVTKNHKNIFIVSPYDAFGPLKSTEKNHMYNYNLFSEFEENLLAGRYTNGTKTAGEIMKDWKLVK